MGYGRYDHQCNFKCDRALIFAIPPRVVLLLIYLLPGQNFLEMLSMVCIHVVLKLPHLHGDTLPSTRATLTPTKSHLIVSLPLGAIFFQATTPVKLLRSIFSMVELKILPF